MITLLKNTILCLLKQKQEKIVSWAPVFFLISNKIEKVVNVIHAPSACDVGMHTKIESHLNSSTYSNWEFE